MESLLGMTSSLCCLGEGFSDDEPESKLTLHDGGAAHHTKDWGRLDRFQRERGIWKLGWMKKKLKGEEADVDGFIIWRERLCFFTQNTLFHEVFTHVLCLWSLILLTLISYMPPLRDIQRQCYSLNCVVVYIPPEWYYSWLEQPWNDLEK